jgi:hypothetical protein
MWKNENEAREQIKALAQFMKNTGIRYEVIKN